MKQGKENVKKNLPMMLGKVLLVMYIVTGILLVVLAALLYKFELSEKAVNIGVIIIYVITGLLGGFLIGKIQKARKYLWGAVAGLGYFLVLLLVSLILNKGLDSGVAHIATTWVLCTASGAIGGMIS